MIIQLQIFKGIISIKERVSINCEKIITNFNCTTERVNSSTNKQVNKWCNKVKEEAYKCVMTIIKKVRLVKANYKVRVTKTRLNSYMLGNK